MSANARLLCQCAATTYGLTTSLLVAVVGALCRFDWKFVPIAFFAGVAVAFGRKIYEVGLWRAGVLALRSLLTGVASILLCAVGWLLVVALVAVIYLYTTYHGNVDSWRKDMIPGFGVRSERPADQARALSMCIAVGFAAGASVGITGWYVASRRWALMGAVGCPTVWLLLYWPETFKDWPYPTTVPYIGVVDGGLIMIYLSAILFALGGWLGDRTRRKRVNRMSHDGIATVS